MKTVFPSRELTHVWAAQSQTHGRAAASIFFDGPAIYSYGRHFCIAKIIGDNRVLFTTRGYSITTSKHISWVNYACNHMEKIYCPNPGGSLLDNIGYWQNQIKSLLDDLKAPRKRPQTKDKIRSSLAELVNEVQKYLDATNQKLFRKHHGEFIAYLDAAQSEKAHENLVKKLARQEKAKQKRLEVQRAEYLKKASLELQKWVRGHRNNWGYYDHVDLPVRLRVGKYYEHDSPQSWIIETSRGASVSYSAGKLLYNLIKAGKDVKGHQIDNYTVISINGVLKIGCHEIERKEIERFAKKEGW